MFSATRKSVQLFNIGLSTRSVLSSKKFHYSRTISNLNFINYTSNRFFSDKSDLKKNVEDRRQYYDTALTLHSFEVKEKKNKETYLECIRKYEGQSGRQSDRVEFIYAALKYMDNFGVNKDLDCYKKLLNVFPKGKMIPTNRFQAEFMHYPKEQKCATYILEKMENNKVIPDIEVERILMNTFGKDSIPIHKFWRIMYWMPKFKNLNPWPLPKPLPNDPLELAKLAIARITSVDFQSEVTVYQTETVKDSIDKTWIVSGIAPTQKKLLAEHKPRSKVIYVEGPFTNWVGDQAVDYFVLLTKNAQDEIKIPRVDTDDVSNLDVSYWKLKKTSLITYPSVHEQPNETIYSVCATGTSSKDSVLSWVRCLQKESPILSELHVVFTLRQKPGQDFKLLEGDPETTGDKETLRKIDER